MVAGALALPVLALYAQARPEALVHAASDYVSFIILLGGLFVISGGILCVAGVGVNALLGQFKKQTSLDLRLKLPLERTSVDDAAQLGGNLLAEQSNVGIEARHANLDFAAGKRRFRKRSRPFESHEIRAAHLSHPKNHSLLAQIPGRCVEIDGP
jgi:hypothetical protein